MKDNFPDIMEGQLVPMHGVSSQSKQSIKRVYFSLNTPNVAFQEIVKGLDVGSEIFVDNFWKYP